MSSIACGVQQRLLKSGSKEAVEGVRALAMGLLEIANSTKLPPRKATLEDWKSQAVKDFLMGKMPEGYRSESDFLTWIHEWNSEKDEEGTLAETYGFILQETIWSLKSIF